jgi:hypothetical protein
MKFVIMHFCKPPVTSFFLSKNSTLFSNILKLCSSRNLGDQVSHPHKTTGEFVVLTALSFDTTYVTSLRYTLSGGNAVTCQVEQVLLVGEFVLVLAKILIGNFPVLPSHFRKSRNKNNRAYRGRP